MKKYLKEYRKTHKRIITPKRKAYMDTYLKEYRKTYKKKRNILQKERFDNDPLFKLSYYTRNMIRKAISRNGYSKRAKTHEILGCNYDTFKEYIESKWEPWMTWDNYGNPNKWLV